MGHYQPFRGNPETKLLYVIDQLIGGINTDFSDDASPDNEFKSIVNFNLDKRGSLYKRMGFGKLNAVSEIFNLFDEIPTTKGKTPEDPNPEDMNDNIIYMKLLQNDNGCFRNLSAFSGEKAYRDYQALYGAQNNSWKLLMITTNNYYNKSTAWLFSCTLPALQYDVGGNPTETETIIVSSSATELPVVFNWNRNLKNIDTIEYFDKIYFTNNDKGLVCFNREDDTFSYSGTGIVGQTNNAYKPNAMEVRKVGFNVLGNDPLHWVDFQGLSTESIQGIYLTTDTNIPLQIIPAGGKFRLNVLYTGSDGGFTLGFKEGETDLAFDSSVNSGLSQSGLKVYNITLKTVPTSEVEIKITKTGTHIDPYYDYYQVGSVDPETKAIAPLNIGNCGMVEMYNRAVYYKDDTIWFSEINTFNYVPNYNYVSLPIEPTDRITKIIYFRNVYIVFTKHRIYKMMGAFGDSDFQLMPLNLSIGCHAPETVVPIENVLYFASPRGLYQLISSANYATNSATFENVKEIDTKVKQLTSDVTMYLGEITDPAVRYNGISERACAIRYKDKYMLFYNTAYQQGDIAALKNLDVLVYQYELKAFSEIKFPIKPTFLFTVDGAIETFCSVKEKEEYTNEETLIEYDFEDQSEGRIISDLSGNGNDGNLVGGTVLSPGVGLNLDGSANTFVKAGIINTDIDITNGFKVNFDAYISSLNGATLFDLRQSTPTGSARQDSFSIYTNWSNGYRAELICNTVPNVAQNKNTVNWKLRWHRDGTGRNGSQNGTFNLKEGANTLISNTNFSFNMGSSTYQDVATGSFVVNHDGSGNYSKNWTLNASSKYPTYSTGWSLGSATSFDVTQYSSWSNYFGIRLVGTATPYNGGCTVNYTPYLHLGTYGSLYVGARAMYAWINGSEHYHEVPAVSSSGGVKDISGGSGSQNINYTGQPTIGIDARYNIRATISDVYRENIDISGFNFTLPSVSTYTITTWNDFSVSGTSMITLSQILIPSYRQIYLKIDGANDNLVIGCYSEFGSSQQSAGNSLGILGRHTWTVDFVKNSSNYTVNVYKDGTQIMTVNTNLNTIVNGNRDNNVIVSGLSGSIYGLTISQSNGNKILNYGFDEGRGTSLIDKSGNSRSGLLNGSCTWLTESGLLFDGSTGYIILPNIDISERFSNGFSIEFEAKFDDINRACKVFDIATGISGSGNKGCSINAGVSSSDSLTFTSTSIDYKTYRLSKVNAGLNTRTLWKFTIVDTQSNYLLSLYKNGVKVAETQFNYGGITNITRKSNFIGKSNDTNDSLFKGMLYNFKLKINASASPIPVYVGAMYEYDTTYDDFGRAMEVELETKGINLQNPLHLKKVKNLFIKGLGGYSYSAFYFELYADGHLVNDPKVYNCFIDEITKQVVYDYTETKELSFNEMTSLLGNMRLDKTRLGNSTYETRKLIVPAKGKNFTIKIYGESNDYLSIESFGFVCKLGKVKEE